MTRTVVSVQERPGRVLEVITQGTHLGRVDQTTHHIQLGVDEQRVKELIDEGYEKLARAIGLIPPDDEETPACCESPNGCCNSEFDSVEKAMGPLHESVVNLLESLGFDVSGVEIAVIDPESREVIYVIEQNSDEDSVTWATPTLEDAYNHADVEVSRDGERWYSAVLYFIEDVHPIEIPQGRRRFYAVVDGDCTMKVWDYARILSR